MRLILPSCGTDANRPKSEEEKRTRTLESKRRWARKNRAEKGSVTGSARKVRDDTRPPTPSVNGSALSDDEDDADHFGGGFPGGPSFLPIPPPPNGGFIDDEEGDSSFDTGSVGGWRAEGPPGLARGGSAPLGAYQSPHQPGHPHASPHYGHQYASASNPFYPHPSLYGPSPVAARRTPGRSGPGASAAVTQAAAMDPYLAAAAAAAADESRAQSLRASSSSAGSLLPGPPISDGSTRRSSRRAAAARTSYAEEQELDDEDLPRLPQLAYHSPIAGTSNPYSQPFHPHAQMHDQPHGPPLSHHQQQHLAPPGYLATGDGALSRPLSPSLISAAASAAANSHRPRSATNSAFPSPYDMAGAIPVSPGGSAPVAMPYYARRQSPTRVVTGSGIAAGIPAPSNGSDAHAAAVSARGGLESPVKLRRTGTNGKGKEAIHPSAVRTDGPLGAGGGGGGGSAGSHAPAPGGAGGPHREDAAGILLALKAGPSSPMAQAHVQSPVSSVRGSAATATAPLGRGTTTRRMGTRRKGKGAGAGGDDSEEEDLAVEGGDEDGLMLRPRSRTTERPVSPWRTALPNQPAKTPNAAAAGAAHAAAAAGGAAEAISPRKRGRSESPAPLLASTSSGEGGSTAAAHALLATAKKAHQFANATGSGGPDPAAGPSWNHEMSLVATPTPGNLMRLGIESSPVVRFGGAGATGGLGGGHRAGTHALGRRGGHDRSDDDEALGDVGDSEADMLRAADDHDAGDDDTGLGARGSEDVFTSSSGGGRRPRRRASLGSSGQGERSRRGGPGGGSSSSGGGAGASSSSAARPLHHHHPVGLSSELGDFNLDPSSSSSGGRAHHHHDPLREDDVPMPGSSSSVVSNSHLTTPAPAAVAVRRSTSANGILPSVPQTATHPHDPFLAAGSIAGSGMLPLSSHALGNLARTSSPPGAFTSYLFSSPAHPQFSKTLGLTAAPGPGVMYTGAGGETPARGGVGGEAANGSNSAATIGRGNGANAEGRGGVGAGSRARELSGSATSGDDDAKSLKTPVVGRISGGTAGAASRRGGGGPPTSVGGMPASDFDSVAGEDESETTGTAGTGRDESQSPGKVTNDGDYDDDDSEA